MSPRLVPTLVALVLAAAPAPAAEPTAPEGGLALRIYDWGPGGRRLLARTEVPLAGGVGRLRLSQDVEDPTPLAEVELRFHRRDGEPTAVSLASPEEPGPPPLALDPGDRALRIEPHPEDGHLTLSASAAPERLAVPPPGTWEVELVDPGS